MTNWQLKRLGDLTVKIGSGVTPKGGSDVFTDTGVLFIRSQNIKNGVVDTSDRKYIPDEIDKKMATSRVRHGDVLYNITGASIGRSAVYCFDEPANVNQHVCIVRLKDSDPNFINYSLSSDVGKRSLWSFQAGGNREGLNFQQLASFRIPIPNKDEQERIVGVLEVWDEYIEKLERKIALKERLKKGLMQQLLTGSRRLPGFNNEWHDAKLGDVSKIKTGSKDNQNKVANGMYPFFVRSPYVERINSYSFDGEAILVPGEGNIGKIFHYINGKFDYHQRVYGVTHFAEHVSGRYIYYYFVKNFAQQAGKHSVKATVDSLRLPTFTNFSIELPEYDEQRAIVDVLDGVSNEIELLKTKRRTMIFQKKYLLKNLITGTIRTPETLKPRGVNS